MSKLDIRKLLIGRHATLKKTALYIRVSTLEQAVEGYSVGEQKERLIAFCKAKGWIVSEIYVDAGYTGSNLNRPGIKNLIENVNNHDIVLVYKLDRLSRSQKDTIYLIEDVFLKNNVDFMSMQESFDTSSPFGKAVIGLLAVFAQLEREQIKERTWMGRVARAKTGLHHGGGHIPIGYEYKNGKLVINPYEAEQIKLIYDWYLAGESLNSITKRLKENGFTNKYSSYNSYSSVRNILDNETYTGVLRFGDVSIDSAHEAIIPKEKFMAVKAIRKTSVEKYGATAFKSKYLLAGLMFCGYCGARYYLRNTGKYMYYSCYSRTKQNKSMVIDPNCCNKHWKSEELNVFIDNKIREILRSPEIAKDIANKKDNKPDTNTVSTTTKRLAEIDKQINKLMELYQIDEIPADILSSKINQLYNEKTTLENSINKQHSESILSFDLVESLLSDAAQIWDFANTDQKRRILQSLISKIVITDDTVNIEWLF